MTPDDPTAGTRRAPTRRRTQRWSGVGLARAARWCSYQVSWRYREWKLGIRTGRRDHGFVVEDDGDCLGYEPIDVRCFEIVLDYLERQAEDHVLLDYGCGKGRAVIMAAQRPFRSVIGVERSRSLCAIAEQNLRQARADMQCADVRVVNADAATFVVPDAVTAIFLFRPFKGDVLAAVVDQVRDSLVRAPRLITLVHVLPASEPDGLSACPWLEKEGLLPAGFWTHVKCVVYRADGAGIEGHAGA